MIPGSLRSLLLSLRAGWRWWMLPVLALLLLALLGLLLLSALGGVGAHSYSVLG